MVHPAISETAKAIKELKIQGARNIAERAVAAIYSMLLDEKEKGTEKEEIIERIKEAVGALAKSRPTEPALRSALAYVLREVTRLKDLPTGIFTDALIESLEKFAERMDETEKKIAEIGSGLIEDGYTIITHCHSSTLMGIFRKASEEKEFTVIVTETRPKYQGKKTAKELLEMGVKVVYIVDSAAYYFMKQADIYMTGADVITADARVINKVGTALIALAAHEFGVPFYVAASTYKFDPATVLGFSEPIEERDPAEVIDPKELKGAEIRNPAFDATPPNLVSGIISEKGVFSPYTFVSLLSSEKTIDPQLETIIKLAFNR